MCAGELNGSVLIPPHLTNMYGFRMLFAWFAVAHDRTAKGPTTGALPRETPGR